jgi:myo-inositol-hexaphosphate 3-phosphohydrolase
VSDGAVSDDCDGIDGVAAHAGALGPRYPSGLFVCQDQTNANPSANQNFKYVQGDKLPG